MGSIPIFGTIFYDAIGMYIPLRKDKDNVIPFKGILKEANETILNERAHAFDEQYQWAYQCAEIAYDCLLNGKSAAKVKFKNSQDDDLRGVNLKVTSNNLLKTNGSITNVNTDGYLRIEIHFNQNALQQSKEECIQNAYDVISHEIMHGHIYWERAKHRQELNDTPDEYDSWVKILEKSDNNSILYMFAYACYSTYYHEIQAMVSQTYAQIADMMGGSKDKTKFLSALRKTNTYMVYNQNIEVCETLKNSGGLINILVKQLRQYGLEYDASKIKTLINKIEKKSKNALKAAYNNAYEYVYNV